MLLLFRKVFACALVALVLHTVYEMGWQRAMETVHANGIVASGMPPEDHWVRAVANNNPSTSYSSREMKAAATTSVRGSAAGRTVSTGTAYATVNNYSQYRPAPVEDYVCQHAAALGFDTKGDTTPEGCPMFTNETATPIYDDLQAYLSDLEEYNHQIRHFEPVSDLRLRFIRGESHEHVCQSVKLGGTHGLQSIFKSGQLSWTAASGLVEPLLPPMRHPKFCDKNGGRQHLLNLDYLVHDFYQMCRNLRPHSRNILIDMGASLDFRHGDRNRNQPAMYLTETFAKFGFPFDHVYAYEISPKVPAKVYRMVPEGLLAAYHWINVGVDPEEGSLMNPLTMLLNNYNANDLIVIKLDIDTPAVEMPLAQQLLRDSRFHPLVDHFYFEHHVHMQEIAGWWKYGAGMEGSIKDSLDLFVGMRQKGIASHFWV